MERYTSTRPSFPILWSFLPPCYLHNPCLSVFSQSPAAMWSWNGAFKASEWHPKPALTFQVCACHLMLKHNYLFCHFISILWLLKMIFLFSYNAQAALLRDLSLQSGHWIIRHWTSPAPIFLLRMPALWRRWKGSIRKAWLCPVMLS